ncbi:FAD-binding oxidoreductase [Streptomyces sp. NPDC001508]|uniref:NAD(P)/FAD-dependent oxidoreductase n=1 Tax=Streptomyces sp. NPDC001508 TaxID=3154656 RepID=UPI00332CC10C
MSARTVPTHPSVPHVVVIGAGIVGTSLGYALLRRGARVTVIDRDGTASSTTGTSFAWIGNPGFFRNGEGISAHLAPRYFWLHRMGMLAWRQLTADIGTRLGIRWNGTVQFSQRGSSAAERLRQDLDRRQRWGSTSFRISPAQIRALVPGIAVGADIDAFTSLDEGHVDPAACCAALMEEIRALGGNVIRGSEATGLDITGARVTAVQTTRGAIACDHVVYAVGANSPKLLGDLGISVPLEPPSQGVLVHLRPMKPLLSPVLITADLHILQRPDGRVVMARHYSGTSATDGEGADANLLLARAGELLPELAGGSVERVTAGERVVPIDGLPVIGHSEQVTNVHSVTTNSGIVLGPVLGGLMATEILTGVTCEQLDPYRAARFGDA